MNITEEILNRYIDGELQPAELEKLNEQLSKSKDDLEKLQALQALHRNLSKMKAEETSSDFTRTVMFRINKMNKSHSEQKYFIRFISSVFVLFSLIITSYVLYMILSSAAVDEKVTEVFALERAMTEAIKLQFENIFTSKNLTLIGYILSMTVLGSAYFLFESFKRIKNKFTS